MNSRKIAVLGALLLGLLVVRYLVLLKYAPVPGSSEVVNSRTLKEARAQAAQEQKLLVVDAFATWCGPCKMMDRDSWPDEAVQAWLKDNAVLMRVDVDADEEATRELRIEAMPTVIVFRDGREVGRIVGYRGPGALLEWLKGV